MIFTLYLLNTRNNLEIGGFLWISFPSTGTCHVIPADFSQLGQVRWEASKKPACFKQAPRTTGYPSSRKSQWTILNNHPTNRPMWSSKKNSSCATNSEKALPILWLDFGSVAAPFALFSTCPVNRSAHLSRDELQTGNSWRAARAKHHKEQSGGAFAWPLRHLFSCHLFPFQECRVHLV